MLQNENIAQSFEREYKDLLTSQFSSVGQGATSKSHIYIKDSQSNFKVYASGRRHCPYMLLELDLIKRQDLLSMVACTLPLHQQMLSLHATETFRL
jgi:hypothetical protein